MHWSFRCCSRSSLLLLLLICFVHISWSYALLNQELFCCSCMLPIIIINPITVSRGVVLDSVRYDVTAVDEWTVQTSVHGHHRNLVGFFIPSTQQHSTLESRAMRAHYNLITLNGPHPLSTLWSFIDRHCPTGVYAVIDLLCSTSEALSSLLSFVVIVGQ